MIIGSDRWMFSWEAPWHSFSNSQAFLIRDCQSHFSMQSHIVDRHRFPQNLIQSWCLIFLVNSPNPKPLISRKNYSASGKRCFALSKKVPKNQTNQPTPHPKQTKKPKQKSWTDPHTNTYNRLQSLELFLSTLWLS